MAKKKTTPDAITAPPTVPAAPKRRAPAKKKTTDGNRQPSQAEIAEAAYFRHLNRGGAPSDEFKDWIEAERDLKERHSR